MRLYIKSIKQEAQFLLKKKSKRNYETKQQNKGMK